MYLEYHLVNYFNVNSEISGIAVINFILIFKLFADLQNNYKKTRAQSSFPSVHKVICETENVVKCEQNCINFSVADYCECKCW